MDGMGLWYSGMLMLFAGMVTELVRATFLLRRKTDRIAEKLSVGMAFCGTGAAMIGVLMMSGTI